MKKIFAFSILIISFLLHSCSKNTDGGDIIPIHVGVDSTVAGTQAWTRRNLDVVVYRNGDPIPQVTDSTTWASLTTGAYCYYNNDSATYAATYGKLYNGYAINDPRGLAPLRWHIPSSLEWEQLVKFCDSDEQYAYSPTAGGALKEASNLNWLSPNMGAIDYARFTALPGGSRNNVGSFVGIKIYGYWWSSTENLIDNSNVGCHLEHFDGKYQQGSISKVTGMSVRCVKD